MNKGVIVIIFVLIFIFVILFARFTGRAVTSINTCFDSDGKDISLRGKVYGTYFLLTRQDFTYEDYCLDDYTVLEYYCSQDGLHSTVQSFLYNCPLGCKIGACIN